MKAVILFPAIFLTAIMMSSSCSKHRQYAVSSVNPLIGCWQLDSLVIGRDTSLAYILTAMAMHEDGGVSFRFTGDSIFTYSQNDIDTTGYKFTGANLIITKDAAGEQIFSYSGTGNAAGLLKSKYAVFFITRKI